MAWVVGFDVAVARAVHLLIDRPIEMYQNRLTLPDPETVPALATVVPSSSDIPSQNEVSEGMDDKDKDVDDDDDGLTTRTESGSGVRAETEIIGKELSPVVVGTGTVKAKKLSQGSDGKGMEEAGTNNVEATLAMKRRVLWDDCMGFLAHVALPGKLRPYESCDLIPSLTMPCLVSKAANYF